MEDFIKNNRKAFDMEEPNPNIWAGIAEQLPESPKGKVRKLTMWRFVKAAAVVLILLTVGGLGGAYWASNYHANQVVAMSLGDVSPEYAELEQFYVQKISTQQKALKSYNHDLELNKDLAELDEMFNELKKELDASNNDERVVHAMIEHYQTKIEILERVLERVQDAENPQKEQTNEIHM